MALKAVHVTDVPSIDQVSGTPSRALRAVTMSSAGAGVEFSRCSSFNAAKFLVVGHRGHGMNLLQSPDRRMTAFKENTILSFNSAAKLPLDFIEFDVQVTKDDCPIIFHDNFILSNDNGTVFERRVTELTLNEFMCYGPQREPEKQGKSLMRKTKDGKILNWDVESDDSHCTLQEAFQKVDPSLGFNIELKFDDYIVYPQEDLVRSLQSILKVVSDYGHSRPVIFSTFQPDAALLVRKLQSVYPVFFLTNGGLEMYCDARRNSLEEAARLCLEGGLQGIVSEVKAIFKNPEAISKIKESKLALLTYGKLNNVPEAVYMQHLMGIEGVIVDLVHEITDAVSDMIKPSSLSSTAEAGVADKELKPQFSEREISFLLKLIPKLIQL
ncbi:hypothetical protein SAY87_007249 [Trapa incisa]|uniref:glycerophosphodiester phosphodiesterase n=1 Tax=Trapa incisa TaxID=236973 RepID=A0AAN7K0W7_9MYRT|nr:hypothetical protein SAY87_007249 [Trapa incisa]